MIIRFFLAFLALAISFTASAQPVSSEIQTAKYFDSIQKTPNKLFNFLSAMPKGGDLHNHESGATYAENMLRYAVNDNLCVNRETYGVLNNPACPTQDLLEQAVTDTTFKDALIDAWSMRHFTNGGESGHDHFFATFGKFGLIASHHQGEILAEVVQRAAEQNELYLELMTTADDNESGKLGKQLGWDPDFTKMREKLLAANFDNIVRTITNNLDNEETKMKQLLSCNSTQPQAGCNIKVRYLYQVLREQSPEMVFAQLLAGFEAASKDKRVLGINMVQPEDGTISMRDYSLHMQMVGFFHKLYPNVQISLHAGELNKSLVPPEGLKFHIRDAVRVANVERIGHGVDIAQEDNADQLLKEMANKRIMVEINLTSNAEILGIEGKDHPFLLYMRSDVPVALSTDDEGVSRGNLTKEYQRAVMTYQLNYPTLKKLARNSITYSFLLGKTLWTDNDYQQVTLDCSKDMLGSDNPSPSCRSFLTTNEKANMQWELEKRFNAFEKHY